ncbi:MAG: DUF2066 domain-containing protein [Rhodospirillales bacterium]|nr:DUF2066 domain-containing protein [Rhodospirillales bacterium]MDE0382137.1 DUF2066 domain-containing protein [Rhodospirillales bacterium]
MMGGSAGLAAASRCVALVCALALFLAFGTARGEGVFTVARVPIDAEAASSAAARELAIAAGQHAALEMLLRRLTVEGTPLPAPVEDSVAAMVAGFEIEGELVSTTRYRASLTVDFDPTEVRRLLRESGIAYAETVSKPVLVVAVQRDSGGIRLWEEGNRWRRAWEERPPRGGLVPILLPLGDIIDLGTVDAARAMVPDAEALAVLGELYGTSEVVVAVAGLSRSAAVAKPSAPAGDEAEGPDGEAPAAGRALTLSLRRTDAESGRPAEVTLIGRSGESERALLERGADRIVALLEDGWKAANLIRYGEDHALQATVPIASLGEWVSIQQRLAALAMVASVEIDSLSVREGRLTLRYHGTADQLRLALNQNDLALEPLADEWVLSPRAAPPEPDVPDAIATDEAE